MKFRWSLAPANPLLATQLSRELGIDPLLVQCLLNRGFDSADAAQGFLQPRLKSLSDPFLLPAMAAAVDRLFSARSSREKLIIFGDYDVDGVTSTALLWEVLTTLGWNVSCYLPHRRDDGYGLTQDGLAHCLERHTGTLLLAVDCGSTAVEAIAGLKERGIDVIVLDHHQVSNPAPPCVALVNPKAATSTNGLEPSLPAADLCSVGLAFKLAHALVKRGRELGLPEALDYDLRPLLELVALGTIADLVPLTGENRILVSTGLERLNTSPRPGIVALKRVAQCPATLGTFEVGFHLAPRLNAAGRLEDAEEALQLLLSRDEETAMRISHSLDAHNRERQSIERQIAQQAIEAVKAKFNPVQDYVIIEGQMPWHIGVVGIVASRVLQQFYRPTIIVGGDGQHWRGSGRSIEGFDLAGALRQCSDLLVRHGGHAMAAGVSIVPGNLEAFRMRMNEIARKSISPEHLQPKLYLDAVASLNQLSVSLLTQMGTLKPTGQGNPPVHIQTCGLWHQRPLQRIGADKQHVKMWVTDGRATHEAIWWNAGAESLPVGQFDLAFNPQINSYEGRTTVQLRVLDWRSTNARP